MSLQQAGNTDRSARAFQRGMRTDISASTTWSEIVVLYSRNRKQVSSCHLFCTPLWEGPEKWHRKWGNGKLASFFDDTIQPGLSKWLRLVLAPSTDTTLREKRRFGLCEILAQRLDGVWELLLSWKVWFGFYRSETEVQGLLQHSVRKKSVKRSISTRQCSYSRV